MMMMMMKMMVVVVVMMKLKVIWSFCVYIIGKRPLAEQVMTSVYRNNDNYRLILGPTTRGNNVNEV